MSAEPAKTHLWTTFGAIEGCDDLDESLLPIDLAEGVQVASWPHWFKDDQINRHLSFNQRTRLGHARFALAVSYEAEALGTPDPGWKPEGDVASLQDHATYRIVQAVRAMWLVRPTRTTVDSIVHAESLHGASWVIRQVANLVPVLPHPLDAAEQWTPADLAAARPLHEALLSLSQDDAVGVAYNAAMQGLQTPNRNMRFLMTWIAVEALFGSAEAREITFRLSSRVAAFLRPNGPDRERIQADVKKGYGWRSKVVHGAGLAKFTLEEWKHESHFVEGIVRDVLRKLVSDPAIRERFNGRKREEFLDGGAFRW